MSDLSIRLPRQSPRLGVASGAFDVPDDIDRHNDEVAELFGIGA